MSDKAKFEFQEGGFFHQMVGSYGAAVCGTLFYNPEFFQLVLDIRTSKNADIAVDLKSTLRGDNIQLKPITTFTHLQKNIITVITIRHNLMYMLLNICYENVSDELDHNKPAHEFFRHLRNAASHGGKFFFKKNQPSRKAEWKGREISASHQGKPIWSVDIEEGDVLLLLHDIEQDLIASTGREVQPSKTILE